METPLLFNTALFFHISGLCLAVGTTVANFTGFQQFWKQYGHDREKAMMMLPALAKFPTLTLTGAVVLILSGISMTALTQGVFSGQLWFRVKMAIVIFTILNGLVIGRRLGMNLRKALLAPAGGTPATAVSALKHRMNLFFLAQITLFAIIFLLSAFKFN